MNTIAKLLAPEDILIDLAVASKAQLFDEIGRHLERVHALPQSRVVFSLARREEIGSTALGAGFAIPHARLRDLDRIQPTYVRLKAPIPFDAPDGQPVSDILVLLVPKEATEEHLTILAEATRMFSDRSFRQRLRACREVGETRHLFNNWPRPG